MAGQVFNASECVDTDAARQDLQHDHNRDASAMSYQSKLTILPCAESSAPNTPVKGAAVKAAVGTVDSFSLESSGDVGDENGDGDHGDHASGAGVADDAKDADLKNAREEKQELKQVDEQKEEKYEEEKHTQGQEQEHESWSEGAGNGKDSSDDSISHEASNEGHHEQALHVSDTYMPRLLHPMRDKILSTWLPRSQQVRTLL
jgi:hypothetical protein